MSLKGFINPWIGASDSNTTGAGNPAASGTTTTTGAGAVLSDGAGNSTTPFDLAAVLGSLKMGLSTEERKELDELNKQYEADIKVLRLDEFKRAPSHLRQMVIDSHDWQETVDKINSITIQPQADRLSELRAKDLSNSQWLRPQSVLSYPYPDPFVPSHGSPLQLPAGLTLQDLKDAHSERCLEEEMLNNGQY